MYRWWEFRKRHRYAVVYEFVLRNWEESVQMYKTGKITEEEFLAFQEVCQWLGIWNIDVLKEFADAE